MVANPCSSCVLGALLLLSLIQEGASTIQSGNISVPTLPALLKVCSQNPEFDPFENDFN
jgi:hypothetical protein